MRKGRKMKKRKSVATILQAVLIFGIAIGLLGAIIPFAYSAVQTSMEFSEIQTVKSDFAKCNDKIIETARTGLANKCLFNAERGKIRIEKDGIYYNLTGSKDICSSHSWTEIDAKRHVWQSCEASDDKRIFGLRWHYPTQVRIEGKLEGNVTSEEVLKPIKFNETIMFRTLTVVMEFESQLGAYGKFLEIARKVLTEEKAVLGVKFS